MRRRLAYETAASEADDGNHFSSDVISSAGSQEEYPATDKGHDMVNHPPHYQAMYPVEVHEAIDICEAFDLNLHRGTAIIYLLRAGKKDPIIRDLKKAIWYINREIDLLRKRQGIPEDSDG